MPPRLDQSRNPPLQHVGHAPTAATPTGLLSDSAYASNKKGPEGPLDQADAMPGQVALTLTMWGLLGAVVVIVTVAALEPARVGM